MSSETQEQVEDIFSILEEYYLDLPDLKSYPELAENIVPYKNRTEFLAYLFKIHPNLQGLITSLATTYTPFIFGTDPDLETMINTFLWSYYGQSLGFSLLKDYGWDKMQRIEPEGEGIFQKAKLALINNPKLVGIASHLSWFAFLNDIDPTLKFDPTLLFAFTFPAYAAGTLSAHFARNNELLKRGFKQYREQNEHEPNLFKGLYNWVFEHPEVVAGVSGVGSFAYLWNNYASTWGIADANLGLLAFRTCLQSLAISTLSYLGTSALSWFLHTDSLFLVKHNLLSKVNSLFNNHSRAIEHMNQIMQVPTTIENEIANHTKLGKLYLKADKTGDALMEFAQAAKMPAKRRDYTNPFDLVFSSLKKINPIRAFTWFKNNIIYGMLGLNNFKSFVHSAKNREYSLADLNLKILLSNNPENVEYHLLYANFCQGIGLNNRADFEFETITSMVLDDQEAFEIIGESRNEVMTYAASEFLQKSLIFKRGTNAQQLQEEFNATTYFRERLGNRIANPLSFVEHDDLFYFLSEHSGNETLYSLAMKGELTQDLTKQALETLALIQLDAQNITDEINISDPIYEIYYTRRNESKISNLGPSGSEYFTNRIDDVFFGQLEDYYGFDDLSLKNKFLSVYEYINHSLVSAERALYKDSNLRNWVVNKSKELGAIDFEGLRLMPTQLELVNILEFVNCFNDDQVKEFLNDYVGFVETESGKQFDFENFYLLYRQAAVQRHLELIGYRARDFSKSKDMQNQSEQAYHFERARDHVNFLINESKENKNLEQILLDLESIEQKIIENTKPTQRMKPEISTAKESNLSSLLTTGVSIAVIGGVVLATILGYNNLTKENVVQTSNQVFLEEEREDNFAFVGKQDQELKLFIVEGSEVNYSLDIFDIDFSWSPDRKKIVFEKSPDSWQVLDLETGTIEEICDYENFSRPIWSPDGKKIAFHKDPGKNRGLVLIYSLKINDFLPPPGGMDFSNYYPVWALDSKKIAFAAPYKDTDGEIDRSLGTMVGTFDMDGSDFAIGPKISSDLLFSLSPNGKKIAFVSDKDGDTDLYLADSDFDDIQPILNSEIDEEYELLWISDNQILLRSDMDLNNPEKDFEIYLVDTDNLGIENLTQNYLDEMYLGGVSLDQGKILFANTDVMIYDLESQTLTNLTNSPEIIEKNPVWTPNGDIVYVLDDQLVKIDSQGNNLEVIASQISPLDGTLK
ncbi:MAG: Protein TolB [Candidatus Woesearchaeota archaeon]|nr:Protein TolB [Candidatus Woesearchaeota archaeon]